MSPRFVGIEGVSGGNETSRAAPLVVSARFPWRASSGMLTGVRLPAVVALIAVALALGLTSTAAAEPGPTPYQHRLTQTRVQQARHTLTVGALTLHSCPVVPRAYCGHLDRNWEPGNPAAGQIRVGFAFVPARDSSRPALGTFVPHEGGPGYSTTGTGTSYAAMYGPLLERRNLLLVDQRGTGLSSALDCPALQNLKGDYSVAARRCGRSLGPRSDDYTSARSADDLAAVIRRLGLGRVDLYGDSYGTFFAQVFAGRHGDLLRSIVLDSAYPTYGESGWYATQGPAMRSSFETACRRSPACRGHGPGFARAMRRVLRRVRRHPWHGGSYDGNGHRMRVTVDAPNLATVAFDATYGPYFYRELTAALRSALRGDRVPLLKIVAEATGGGTGAGPVRAYSEGLDAAVACHDYPQLYDMAARPKVRLRQYARALTRRTARRPGTYGPFTIHEYARSDWQSLDWCTRWPTAPSSNPAHPPHPRGGTYPLVPTLVLSGELDSITTPAEGAMVAGQFPRSMQIHVANSFHVTAVGDTDDCAVRILRRFVRTPSRWPRHGCASRVPPLRTMGSFPRTLRAVPAGSGRGSLLARRIAPAAALTVADLLDRWWNNYSGHSPGLRGGRWSYTGDRTTVFHLHGVRLTRDLAVSGTATWKRFANTLHVALTVAGHGRRGRLHGHWATRRRGARATLHGTFGGHPVTVTFRAP
jgi:pimeloyl-ACP methyl ester carboxylesterase